MNKQEELITASEMAQRLGVGEATIYRYITDRRIPATQKRWGLRHRWEVLRVDFERVAPGLMGLAGGGTIDASDDIRTTGHAASSLQPA